MKPDKWQALQQFWESFGLPAYGRNSVPKDAQMPYITYEASVTEFETTTPLSANIYYRSTSWADISRKALEIQSGIGMYYEAPIEGGYIHITQGTPFAQRTTDEDPTIKRMYINIEVEYFAP